ncbi:hypothetical protein P885DRAFT_79450 [Corynascus similis CBS 632.67]
MNRFVLSAAKRKALKKHKSEKINSANPLRETVRVEENGRIKYKEQDRPILDKKESPFDPKDRKILKKVCKKAYRWDQQFHCCCFGVRFGWASIIGLIPVIGDTLEVLMSLSLVWTASTIDGGLPRTLVSKMIFYIALDFAIGFIPLLGDLFDVGYRANTRNAWLVNNFLVEEYAEGRRPKNRDLEHGVEPSVGQDENEGAGAVQTAQAVPAAPMAVPPARTPAPKTSTPPPGRSLTGRQVRDPRDGK